jgi:hypothetical protein
MKQSNVKIVPVGASNEDFMKVSEFAAGSVKSSDFALQKTSNGDFVMVMPWPYKIPGRLATKQKTVKSP